MRDCSLDLILAIPCADSSCSPVIAPAFRSTPIFSASTAEKFSAFPISPSAYLNDEANRSRAA
jgi:hypothetical protein